MEICPFISAWASLSSSEQTLSTPRIVFPMVYIEVSNVKETNYGRQLADKLEN